MHRRTDSRRIVTDGRILGEIEQVRHTLLLAQQAERFDPQVGEESVGALERQLAELAKEAAEGSLLIKVEALPAEEFDEIARRHPPSAEQLDRWREQAKVFPLVEMPEYNPQTMGPDLLAACMVEPEWSLDWWKGLSKGTQNQIWNLAHSVQVQGADLPFFNAVTATTNGGGDRSTMPASKEYPSQNS